MHLLRSPPQPGRPPEPDPRPDPAPVRDPQPLSLQQRPSDGGAARPRSRFGVAPARSARGAGRDAADRHPAGGPGLQSAGPQRRDEPGADRGSRDRRARPLARGASLERGHQLHARPRRHEGDDRALAGELGSAAPVVRPRILEGPGMVKEQVAELVRGALQRCVEDGLLPPGDYPVQLDVPKQAAHGDFSSNAAMTFARQHAAATGAQKPNPRPLPQAIVQRIDARAGVLAGKPEIAGPGFLNLRLAQDVWHKALHAVWEQRERFGRSNAGNGLRTMVEFVSANPTGPMHVGHGRGAVIGDVVANLLEWAGYSVYREFYINDAGGQVWRVGPPPLGGATPNRARRAARAARPRGLPGRVRHRRGARVAGVRRRSVAALRKDPRAAAGFCHA